MGDPRAEALEVRRAGALAARIAGAVTAAYAFWFVAMVFASTNSTAVVSLIFLPLPALAVFGGALCCAFLGVSIAARAAGRPVATSQLVGGAVGVALIVPACAVVVSMFWG